MNKLKNFLIWNKFINKKENTINFCYYYITLKVFEIRLFLKAYKLLSLVGDN